MCLICAWPSVCLGRSPDAGGGYYARYVSSDGSLNNSDAYGGNRGVRPDLIETETE